jgi:hypothetical protein
MPALLSSSDAGPRVRTHAYTRADPFGFTLTSTEPRQSMQASVETLNTWRHKRGSAQWTQVSLLARPMLRMRKYKRGVQEEESLAKLDLCYTAIPVEARPSANLGFMCNACDARVRRCMRRHRWTIRRGPVVAGLIPVSRTGRRGLRFHFAGNRYIATSSEIKTLGLFPTRWTNGRPRPARGSLKAGTLSLHKRELVHHLLPEGRTLWNRVNVL